MKEFEDQVKQIRSRDIIPILQNALNYGNPWGALYQAAIEEITELRQKVINLTDYVPKVPNELLKQQYTDNTSNN